MPPQALGTYDDAFRRLATDNREFEVWASFTEAAGLSADHELAGSRAPFGLARKDSRDDAFGGIAGTVPGNSFDF